MICGTNVQLEEDEREQYWKRVNNSTENSKLQAIIVGIHSKKRTMMRTMLKMHAGLMWQDDDFDSFSFDPHCLPLDAVPEEEVMRRTTELGLKNFKTKILGLKVIQLWSSISFVKMEV